MVNATSNTIISGNVDLNGDIDVDGHTYLDNVSVAGITSFAVKPQIMMVVLR